MPSSSFTVLFLIIVFIAVFNLDYSRWSIRIWTMLGSNFIRKTYHTVGFSTQGIWDIFISPIKGYASVQKNYTLGAIEIFYLF